MSGPKFKLEERPLIESLLPYIRGRGELAAIVADELAERFDTCARTVYRRLELCRCYPDDAERLVQVRLVAQMPTGASTSGESFVVGADAARLPPIDLEWPLMTPVAGSDAPAAEAIAPTVLEILAEAGPLAFHFDWELIGLVYLYGGNLTSLYRALESAGVLLPSYMTFWRRWRELPPLVRDGARRGLKNRAGLGLYVRHSAANANDVWQLDAFHLDIEVRVRVVNKYHRVRPTLLLLIDDHSRLCVGWSLTYRNVHAEDVKALFGQAFELHVDPETGECTGGVPQCVVVDNEAAIVAAEVRAGLISIPMAVRPAPVHTPTAKGKVERAGQTIQALVVTAQPGVQTQLAARNGDHLVHAPDEDLWEEADFLVHVAKAIDTYNNSPMAALQGRTRREAYLSSLVTAGARRVDDELLAQLMLPVERGGKRLVAPSGIEVNGHFYLAAELGAWLGSKKKLRVTRWHHDNSRVGVFDPDGRFLCMATRVDLLSDEDRARIVATRHRAERQVLEAAAYARGLMTFTAEQRELADVGAADGAGDVSDVASTLSPSPVPASTKSGAKSGKARPDKRRGNASKPKTAPARPRGLSSLVDEGEADDIALEQMSRKFGVDKAAS